MSKIRFLAHRISIYLSREFIKENRKHDTECRQKLINYIISRNTGKIYIYYKQDFLVILTCKCKILSEPLRQRLFYQFERIV